MEFVTDRVCSIHTTVEAFLEEYTQITQDDIHACLEYAATGAKLPNTTWAELDPFMNEQEEHRKEEWAEKNASDG